MGLGDFELSCLFVNFGCRRAEKRERERQKNPSRRWARAERASSNKKKIRHTWRKLRRFCRTLSRKAVFGLAPFASSIPSGTAQSHPKPIRSRERKKKKTRNEAIFFVIDRSRAGRNSLARVCCFLRASACVSAAFCFFAI